MAARDFRDYHPLFKRFGDDRRLDRLWPPPTPASPGDDLDPAKHVNFRKRLAHRRMTRSSTRRIPKEPSLSRFATEKEGGSTTPLTHYNP